MQSLHEVLQCHPSWAVIDPGPCSVGRMQITLGEHAVGRVKLVKTPSSLGSAAQRLTLSRYVARLKPRCGSLALSVMWYVRTVSQVWALWLDLRVKSLIRQYPQQNGFKVLYMINIV